MVKDMTKGSPLRLLLSFAVPLLVGNIFQQLYSVVDALVLGRVVGVNALAAAGATGSIHFFVFGFVQGLTHGYSVLISQRFGANDAAGVRRAAANALWLSVLSAAVITALSLAGSRAMLTVLRTPPDILEDALLYIRILFIGMTTTVLYNALAGILRALGNSTAPLAVLVVSAVLNVGLDVLFVMGLGGGVAGAAWATVLSQAVSAVLCLLVLARMPQLQFLPGERRPDAGLFAVLLRLGVPVGLMNSITAVGIVILQAVVNGFGSVAVAAYTAGSRITGLAEQPSSIVAMSLGTFVGQNIGAGRHDRVRRGVREALLFSLALDLALGAVMVICARPLTAAFVSYDQTAVLDTAQPYVVATGAALWALGTLFTYRFSLQSMGDTFVPMLSGVLELAARIAVVWLLATVFRAGFLSVCIAEVSAWGAAAVMLAAAYYIRMHRLEKEKE